MHIEERIIEGTVRWGRNCRFWLLRITLENANQYSFAVPAMICTARLFLVHLFL